MDTNFELMTKKDVSEWVQILNKAFPEDADDDFNTWLEKNIENREMGKFYGAFRGGKLVGGMRIFDISLYAISRKINAHGLNLVAVDFLHKKERIAKDIVFYHLENAKNSGTNMAMLYAFRTDFYKNMGFGYGTNLHQFSITPSSIPKQFQKNSLEHFEKEKDKQSVIDCYHRALSGINGMTDMREIRKEYLFKNNIIIHRENNKITGYLTYKFEKVSNKMNLVVDEFIYENNKAFSSLCAFLKSQSDQINRIIINTYDEDIKFAFTNPGNGNSGNSNSMHIETSTNAVGVMYRIVSIKGIFKEFDDHNFGNETINLKLTIKDDFLDENNESFFISFKNGKANLFDTNNFDVEITLDISEFSSLFMGAISFEKLFKMSLANISDESYLESVDRIFKAEKPVCADKWF